MEKELERVKGIEPSCQSTSFKTLICNNLQIRHQRNLTNLFLPLFLPTVMASVAKHPKSKFWYACYTDKDGKQRKCSTRTTDKRKATRFAIELEAEESKARETPQTNSQLQKAFTDLSQRINGDGIDVPIIEDYFREWLEKKRGQLKPKSFPRYEKSIRAFVDSLGKKRHAKLTEITPKNVSDFISARRAMNLAPNTVILDCKVVGTALGRAEKFGIITKNPVPAAGADLPKRVTAKKEPFTPQEVQELLHAALDVEWQTITLLSYLTGARLSDCTHMQWSNIDPDKGVITFTPEKTGKEIVVPMHHQLIKHFVHISQYGTNGYLTPTLANKGTGGNCGLSASFSRIMKKAGVDPRPIKIGKRTFNRRSFHSLRHTFASILANSGVSAEIRMKLVGHTTHATHAGYTHLELPPLKAAIDSAPLMTERQE